jgi:PAS domain S-box-containing protein
MTVPFWLVLTCIAVVCVLCFSLGLVLLRARALTRRRELPGTAAEAGEENAVPSYDELKRRMSFFEALLFSAADGITAVDNEGNSILVNRRDSELWGFPPDMVERNDREEKHRFVTNLVKDPERVEENRRLVEENPDACIREESELKDGRTFDVYSSPVYGADGTHLGRIYMFHDMTARKQAMDALRKSEMTLRSILSASPTGLALIDPDGRPEWANDAMTAITGYSSGEVRNVSSMTLYETEEEFLRVQEVVYEAARRGELGTTHTKWVSKDGRVLDVLLSALATDPKDPETRVVVSARDVTVYKRGEAELRAGQERYRVLFEDSPAGLVEFDASMARSEILNLKASGVNDLKAYFDDHPGKLKEIVSLVKFLHLNKAAFDIYEVPRGRGGEKAILSLGKLMRESLFGLDVSKVAEFADQLEVEAAATTLTGRKIHLFSKWIVVPGFEHSHGRVIVSFVDVTRQKESEAALRTTRDHLSDAAELAHMAFWELDETGQNFIYNDFFYALLGTTAEREGGYLMPKDDYYQGFIHPDDRARVLKGRDEAWKNRPDVIQFEHRIIRRDGQVRHIRTRTRVKWTDAGAIAMMYGVNQDITDLKTTEENLQKALAQIEPKKEKLDKG